MTYRGSKGTRLGTSRFAPRLGVKKEINRLPQVHAQQYQKQQENLTAILTRSCNFGVFNPQISTLLINRQQHLFFARFSSTTVDLGTSPVD
ncbi:hypothetical protein F2Q69_00012613 [Brassica cretica]|uniref:Uncharacterized protein n=1 Tax=Brassica cretica TaxID=69181 RepID=A0A8S9R946_BRACR|nr:hypothetical protein F2Q69_00012613 [Brassica cretica]